MTRERIEELRRSLTREETPRLIEGLVDVLKQIGTLLEEHDTKITELEQELNRLKEEYEN